MGMTLQRQHPAKPRKNFSRRPRRRSSIYRTRWGTKISEIRTRIYEVKMDTETRGEASGRRRKRRPWSRCTLLKTRSFANQSNPSCTRVCQFLDQNPRKNWGGMRPLKNRNSATQKNPGGRQSENKRCGITTTDESEQILRPATRGGREVGRLKAS